MTSAQTQTIYLDYNASTPLDPRVAEVVERATRVAFGNPSSTHWAGSPAQAMLGRARRQVADLLGCGPDEIVFTSGGSESNNFALKGLYHAGGNAAAHVVTSRVEHPAIVAPCRFLERLGARITWLEVDAAGCVDPEDLRRSIRPDTLLVSIMHANNEVGTIQPIRECAAIAREHGVAFHTDAAQSVGKIPAGIDELGVDLLSIAGHKLYAPKGVGALYVRRGLRLEPLIHGAGHENGRRAGTESVLLTAALGEACALARDLAPMERVRALRDRMWTGLREALGERVRLNGHAEQRLPNTLNVSFPGQVGAELLARVPEIAASTGSACHSGEVRLSPVLRAMGIRPEAAAGTIRFSLGRWTTEAEIDFAVGRFVELLG